MSGYICLHRKIMDNPIWTQMPESRLKVWLTILLRANWQPSKAWDFEKKCEVEIPAGTMLTSREDLIKQSGCTAKEVRLALEFLAASQMICVKSGTRGTLISVLNWSTYQPQGPAEGQPRASEGPTEGQQRAISEEVKKERNTQTQSRAFDAESWTERLYAIHTKKRNKGLVPVAVMKIYERCAARGVDPERKLTEIEACLIAWNQTKDWRKENGRFAPQLAEWLNDDGFERWPGADDRSEDQPVFRLMM